MGETPAPGLCAKQGRFGSYERFAWHRACPWVVVSAEGKVFTTVTDPAFGEPYTLHLTDEAVGAFVGRVRGGYALALQEIADKATVLDVFRTTQAQGLIDYALHSFGETLEHLWPKTPEYAILRRADTDKWYAVFMRIPGTKIGLASPELIEITDIWANTPAWPAS